MKTKGTIIYVACLLLCLCLVLTACGDGSSGSSNASDPSTNDTTHVHSLNFVEQIEAGCTYDGTREHYACTGCSKLFLDADGDNEITADSLVIPAAHSYEDGACTACGELDLTVEATKLPMTEEEIRSALLSLNAYKKVVESSFGTLHYAPTYAYTDNGSDPFDVAYFNNDGSIYYYAPAFEVTVIDGRYVFTPTDKINCYRYDSEQEKYILDNESSLALLSPEEVFAELLGGVLYNEILDALPSIYSELKVVENSYYYIFEAAEFADGGTWNYGWKYDARLKFDPNKELCEITIYSTLYKNGVQYGEREQSAFISTYVEESYNDFLPSIASPRHNGHYTDYVPATCLEDGSFIFICRDCGVTLPGKLFASGHSYSDIWSRDKTSHWHAPSCGCELEPKDKEAHTFENDICTVCGECAYTNVGLSYNENSDGSYTVYANDYLSGVSEVIIPSTYNGKPVTKVKGFENLTSLKKITIPTSVTEICAGTFFGCSSLEEMVLPFVGGQPFNYEVTDYENSRNYHVLGYLFGEEYYDGSIPVTQQYEKHAYDSINGVYLYKYNTTTYYLPASLKSLVVTSSNVYYYALRDTMGMDAQIKYLTLQQSSKYYASTQAMLGIKTLDGEQIYGGELVTDEQGYVFSIVDGYAYLVDYVGVKSSITLPESYEGGSYTVREFAFSNHTKLAEVVVPSGDISIYYKAFANCFNLISFKAGEGVNLYQNYIENESSAKYNHFGIFYGCWNLERLIIPSIDYSLAHLFGTVEFAGSYQTTCWYEYDEVNDTWSYYAYHYVPESLKSVTVLGGSISPYAFPLMSSLTYIDIKGTTSVKSGFNGCNSLELLIYSENVTELSTINSTPADKTIVILGKNITSIAEDSVGTPHHLYYLGTEKEWSEVTVGEFNYLSVYYYSEEEPEGEGNFWHYWEECSTPIAW